MKHTQRIEFFEIIEIQEFVVAAFLSSIGKIDYFGCQLSATRIKLNDIILQIGNNACFKGSFQKCVVSNNNTCRIVFALHNGKRDA